MKMCDTQSPARRLALAVRLQSPSKLARHFAAFSGQFYDRSDYHSLACRARDLYADESPERAASFCRQLDRRLHDRYHAPVAWDIAPSTDHRAA